MSEQMSEAVHEFEGGDGVCQKCGRWDLNGIHEAAEVWYESPGDVVWPEPVWIDTTPPATTRGVGQGGV